MKIYGAFALRVHSAAVAAALLLICSSLLVMPVYAGSTTRSLSNFASGTGNILYLGAAVGLPLLQDGKMGKVDAVRTADGIGSAVILTEGLKYLVKEQRPDHSDHDSFPSGHATAAFAAATMESHYHPHETVYWYAGATLIAQSRVRLHRHYERDVIAGALIGYGMARLELSMPHGLILSPVIDPLQRSAGLEATMPIH